MTQKIVRLEGLVIKERFAPGSKSDHMAIFFEINKDVLLNPDDYLDKYKMIRPNNNPFEEDPVLENLVGHYIEAQGQIHRYTFRVDSYKKIKKK